MLEFDATLLFAMVSFIIFMVLMNIVLYKPIQNIVEKRMALLNVNADEVNQNQTNIDSMTEEKAQKLNEAKISARDIISSVSKEAKKQKDDLIQDVTAKTVQFVDNSKNDIKNEVHVVKTELNDDVIDLAQRILSKVAGEEIAMTNVNSEKISEVLNNGN